MDSFTASQTFPRFATFPAEIRLKVWEAACRVERIITLLPGVAHLAPLTHRYLTVPPLLHACSESRSVGLAHYDLSLHPNIYSNPALDRIMLHLTFPQPLIDFRLYIAADFNRSSPVAQRLAVFLDDISFRPVSEVDLAPDQDGPSDPHSLYQREWAVDVTRPGDLLLPFSDEFVVSLHHFPLADWYEYEGGGPVELTLLVLPPLTARPNPVHQRVELVESVESAAGRQGLREMEAFLGGELESRAPELNFDDDEDESKWEPPKIRVRFATCTPWQQPERAAETQGVGKEWGGARRYTSCMDESIEEDMRTLSQPYFYAQGLGPVAIWHRIIPLPPNIVGPESYPYLYEGALWSLWPEDDELQEEPEGYVRIYQWNGLRELTGIRAGKPRPLPVIRQVGRDSSFSLG